MASLFLFAISKLFHSVYHWLVVNRLRACAFATMKPTIYHIESHPYFLLLEIVLFGVGYHHAGMDASDRKSIETMFSRGELPVLCESTITYFNLTFRAFFNTLDRFSLISSEALLLKIFPDSSSHSNHAWWFLNVCDYRGPATSSF